MNCRHAQRRVRPATQTSMTSTSKSPKRCASASEDSLQNSAVENTVFLSFSRSPTSDNYVRCGFLRFVEFFSNIALLNNCSTCRLIHGHRRARLETKLGKGYRPNARLHKCPLFLYSAGRFGVGVWHFLTQSSGILCRSPRGCVLDVWSVSSCRGWHVRGTLQHRCASPHGNYYINPDCPVLYASTGKNVYFKHNLKICSDIVTTTWPFFLEILKRLSGPSCPIRETTPHRCFFST